MKKKAFLKLLGFAFSVLPPLIATVDQLPLMSAAGKWSVLAIIAIILCCMPFIKHLKRLLASPSAWMMWLLIFVFCVAFKAVIDEFYTISLFGLLGSAVGVILFKLAKEEKSDG